MTNTLEIATPSGLARVHVHSVGSQPRAALMIGHGAGGGVEAPDICAVTAMALAHGIAVALVEQPYRVAGRRAPAPAPRLDAAWIAVAEALRSDWPAGLLLVAAGRSMGARVACRTAAALGAAGVLCLAFPVQPAARKSGTVPPDRLHELDAVAVPALVVQGERDAFGMPPAAPGREVAVVPGDHSLKKDVPAVVAAVEPWLLGLVARQGG